MLYSLKKIFLVILFAILIYFLHAPFIVGVLRVYNEFTACRNPIKYSIGTFDSRFGVSKESFLKAVADSAGIWDKAGNKQFFIYSSQGGDVIINLVYDYRQEATDKLKKLGVITSENLATYESLRSDFDQKKKQQIEDVATLKSRIAIFTNKQNIYNESVVDWNNKGGAPKDVYQKLGEEKIMLDNEAREIKKIQDTVNALADTINAYATVLNRMAHEYNLEANEYNQVNESRGREFEEGLYESNSSGDKISIYEFTSQEDLRRVLAHELGHALGLQHVSNSKAIMYSINQAKGLLVTEADLEELKKVCHLK